MCGIYGIISRTNSGLSHEDDEILKQMMLDTVQRGDNSSGLFMTDYLDPHVEPTGVKVLGGPHNIIYNTPLWREVGNFIQRHAGAVIGHGRWATRGKVTAENAHPFQHEHITLVHNGTIHGGVSYAKKGDVDIDVDSHALAVSMAEKGVLEALAHVRGAYAVVVHDSKEGCLYLARNDDRPLHVYTNATRHYIMSEGMFLDAILARYGKKIPDQHVMYFKAEQLIKIDLDKPAEYVVAGDIKIRREAIEAEERELRRKEAEANRKKYESSSKKHQGDAGKERSVLTKELKQITFLVERLIKFGVNFKYFAKAPDGSEVTFISDQEKPDYIGRIGSAKIHSYVYSMGTQSMFVRHRDIDWVEVVEEKEEPTTVGTFLTYNNKRINASDWTRRLVHEGCNTCAKTFKFLDYRNVVLTDDDLLLCIPCAQEFSVVKDTDRMH